MNLLRRMTVFLLAVLTIGFQPVTAKAVPEITAHSAIVIDAGTGEAIYEKNSDTIMYPASTTKIMTALLAVENGNLEQTVTIGEEVNLIAWDSSRAYLQAGDTISLRELVYGMMLASGNDAAYAIAVHIARISVGDQELSAPDALDHFSAMMNERAEKAGAFNTSFVNPDGYPHTGHFTTAKDLALIMAEAMKNPEFREFVATVEYRPQTWVGVVRSWINGNYLIQPDSDFFYAKATGGKTGYTVPAGFTMVATAAEDDMKLVAVALNTDADGRWLDTTNMLEYGFANHASEVDSMGSAAVAQGEQGQAQVQESAAEPREERAEPVSPVLLWLQRLLQFLRLM